MASEPRTRAKSRTRMRKPALMSERASKTLVKSFHDGRARARTSPPRIRPLARRRDQRTCPLRPHILHLPRLHLPRLHLPRLHLPRPHLPILQMGMLPMHVRSRHNSMVNEPHMSSRASCKRKRKQQSRNIEGWSKRHLKSKCSIV